MPPAYAAEMEPFNALMGEFRVHYAGFFDPGFGMAATGGEGSRAVLEVRSHKVPFILEDGQIVGRQNLRAAHRGAWRSFTARISARITRRRRSSCRSTSARDRRANRPENFSERCRHCEPRLEGRWIPPASYLHAV